jgi:uncharacterized RDD family membrane protein YckC
MSDAPPPPSDWRQQQDWSRPPAPEDEQISGQYGPPSSQPGYPTGYQAAASGVGAPADWWRRLVAIILDGLVLTIPNAILVFLFGIKTTETDVSGNVTIHLGSFAAVSFLSLIVAIIYSGLLEGSSHGQSVGKMALRIQVRDATTGGPIGFARAAGRRFIYQILFLPLFVPGLINGLSPLWDARRQAWHDKAVNTLVVNSA